MNGHRKGQNLSCVASCVAASIAAQSGCFEMRSPDQMRVAQAINGGPCKMEHARVLPPEEIAPPQDHAVRPHMGFGTASKAGNLANPIVSRSTIPTLKVPGDMMQHRS